MDKEQIRQVMRQLRGQLSQKVVAEKSQKIAERLKNQKEFLQAQSILLYWPHQNEVDVTEVFREYSKVKRFYLPKLVDAFQFDIVPFGFEEELTPNQFGILEPPSSESFLGQIDLILVPGLAFDRGGGRIGMGKGYYDRFLAYKKESFKVGLAYEKQILDQLPKAPYDERVDLIITEEEIIHCTSG